MLLSNLWILSFQRPFYERWKLLEKEVIEPRNIERQHMYQSPNPYYRYDLEPFRVSIPHAILAPFKPMGSPIFQYVYILDVFF